MGKGDNTLEKNKQDLKGDAPVGDTFVPTEMGSARFASLDGEGSTYKYETGPTRHKQGTVGPPWGVQPSMHFVCDEAGIDYQQFVEGLQQNKSDQEMAEEFKVKSEVIKNLKNRFYRVEGITGNYGQD